MFLFFSFNALSSKSILRKIRKSTSEGVHIHNCYCQQSETLLKRTPACILYSV